MAWLSQPVHPNHWAQIRVTEAVPITDLLQEGLKTEIERLYSRLISFRPALTTHKTLSGESLDENPHFLKTINDITIHTCDFVESLVVDYSDGTQWDLYGIPSDVKHVFSLRGGEFITEVVAWSTEGLCALQFMTSKGRMSQHYGGNGGKPTLLSSKGGALVAFSGDLGDTDDYGIHGIQTIWRHDLIPPQLTPSHKCSEYLGGVAGEPFNDWSFLKNSMTAHVSCVRVRSGSYVHSIQATYRGESGGKQFTSPSWPHGGSGGLEDTFLLEPGEFITAVSGRHDDTKIIQLYFTTSRDRTSLKYGRSSGGQTFKCRAPVAANGKPMRLCFITGKSSACLNGIMFVWASDKVEAGMT
ncbi:hypothetical protein FS749_007570 [Ceratobasidium sp. UAMH 11750]|nr:hypothetical protein FS749_007570 [Ceratobasidium sp. UAMH 11750]